MLKAILFSFVFGTAVGTMTLLFGDFMVLVYYNSQTEVKTVPDYDTDPLANLQDSCPDVLRLAVLIFSAPDAELRRKALRETWIQDANTSEGLVVELKFLIGTDGLNETVLEKLRTENSQFNDMLLFDDIQDSFKNLTSKLLRGIQWAHKHLTFDYLMKTDDDCYVRLDKVGSAIRGIKCLKHLYIGYFIGGAWPQETGKYIETKWYMCEHYINYASGAGYILSKSAVSMLLKFADKLYKEYNNDDVSIAVWLAPFDLVRIHDLRLDFRMDDKPACSKHYIVSHRHNVETLHKYHDRIHNNRNLCPWREGVHYRYLYQWHVRFQECCEVRRFTVNDNSFSVFVRSGKVL